MVAQVPTMLLVSPECGVVDYVGWLQRPMTTSMLQVFVVRTLVNRSSPNVACVFCRSWGGGFFSVDMLSDL